MPEKLNLPTVADLTCRLLNRAALLDTWKLDEREARLQAVDGIWQFLTGDPQYDTDHRGCWGNVSVPAKLTKKAARELAKELINQVRDDHAQRNG